MTAQATENSTSRVARSGYSQPSAAEIDLSCRTPLMLMFTSSVVWLVISLLFAVLASVKSHAPGMLADVPALTFGRVAGIASSTFLYGFASQAGIAIAMWLFARMGRTLLVIPRLCLGGWVLWNVGVTAGVIGIMAGGLTHFPAFEMPVWTVPILFIAYTIFGVSALLTFNARTERELYPSNWFLLAALFVFPWIYSTAGLLLGKYPIRGVMEPIISIWFANNFTSLWLGSLALATLFYLIPKISERPLYSYSMAAFGFWFYVLFAHGGGYQNTVGLPAWMGTLSSVLNSLLLIPIVAIVWNWYQTWSGHNRQKKQKDVSSKYIVLSTLFFIIGSVLMLLLSCPAIDQVVGLTIFVPGTSAVILYGFIAFAFFAAIYHIVPRLVDVDWARPGMIKGHFLLTLIGLIISAGALLFGGIMQGNGINNPAQPFPELIRRIVPFLGMNSLGLTLMLIGQILLLVNLGSMLRAFCLNCCGQKREVAR